MYNFRKTHVGRSERSDLRHGKPNVSIHVVGCPARSDLQFIMVTYQLEMV